MPRKKKIRKRIAKRTETSQCTRRSDGIKLPKGFSTPLIRHFSFDNPFTGLTDDQKLKLMGTLGDDAAKSFGRGIDKLGSVVMSHDPVELLSTAAFYCLFKHVGPNTDFTDDGPYPQTMIELLQSTCLRFTLDQFGSTPVLHPYLFKILDVCKQCSEDFGKKRYTSCVNTDPSKKNLLSTIEGARLHTQLLRNWGYPQHIRQIVRQLLDPLESDIAACVGIGPISFLELIDELSRRSCERAFEFMETLGDAFRQTNLRKMVNEFCKLTETSNDDTERTFKLVKSRPGSQEDKRLFLLSYFHQFLPNVFLFTIKDCVDILPASIDESQLQAVLDQMSFEFGDLASENPEHLIMQSKIRTRPLVRIGETEYFLPIHGLFNSFFLEILETWLKPHDELKRRYHKRRAVFLEVTLERLLEKAFPGCLVRARTTWIDPHDSKEYENDCLVVCGPFALVFEAKSERVNDAARRGSVKTLTDH